MRVRLYTISDDPKTISKSVDITAGTVKDGTIRDAADVLYPSIVFDGNITGFNYAYIADFGRFYFLDPPVFLRNGLTMIKGRVDVLHSFESDIRKLPAIPVRSASAGDWYLRDTKQPVRAYRTIWTAEGTEMAYDTNFVLITAG